MNRTARSDYPNYVSGYVNAGVVRGVILYDGQCGFCSRWVKYWARTLGRHGFEIASLDEPWVAQKIKMPHEELLTDIRLLTADGQLISGVFICAASDLVDMALLCDFQFAGVQSANPLGI